MAFLARLDRCERWAGAKSRADDDIGGVGALRVAGDSGDERAAVESIQANLAGRADGRGAWHVTKKGDLTKVVAGPERANLVAVDADRDLAEVDHVDPVGTVVALRENDRAGRNLCRLELRGKVLEREPRQRAEDRRAGKEPDEPWIDGDAFVEASQ